MSNSFKVENRKYTKKNIPEVGVGPFYTREVEFCFILALGCQNIFFFFLVI